MKQEKCHGRPPAGSTDHPFWGPYRRFVKGEMARSALEKASYMDIVYGCPLDAIVSFMEGSGNFVELLLSASFLD